MPLPVTFLIRYAAVDQLLVLLFAGVLREAPVYLLAQDREMSTTKHKTSMLRDHCQKEEHDDLSISLSKSIQFY